LAIIKGLKEKVNSEIQNGSRIKSKEYVSPSLSKKLLAQQWIGF
jgi:hypothetical protein